MKKASKKKLAKKKSAKKKSVKRATKYERKLILKGTFDEILKATLIDRKVK